MYLNNKLIAYTGQVPADLEIGDDSIKKNKRTRRRAPKPTLNKRPGWFGPDFMDDDAVAIGASYCSNKGALVELSKKPPVDAWDSIRPYRARQPWFKGVERNRRRLSADIWH